MNIIRKRGPRPPIPEYSDEDFVGLYNEKTHKDRHMPQADWHKLPEGNEIVFEVVRERYWYRVLFAVAEASEWVGPFDTLAEARADFIATFGE